MSIADYVPKPIKWIDERIQKTHTAFALKKGIDKGKRRYKVGLAMNMFSMLNNSFSSLVVGGSEYGPLLNNVSYWAVEFFDFEWNFHGLAGTVNEDSISSVKKSTYFVESVKTYCKGIRLPVLAIGITSLGKGGINLYNQLINGEAADPLTPAYIQYGIGMIVQSSSMYLKDIDPKLLEKASVKATVSQWVTEKFREFTAPVPEPARVHYRTIDSLC